MDSLTQITLGAAVGEAVLGRRVGNRAMLWGAIGGTIPDLDTLASWVTDDISALAYHRAFTHSLLFAVLAAPALGWLVHRLYGGHSPRPGPLLWLGIFGYLLLLIWAGSAAMPLEVYGTHRIAAVISAVIIGLALVVYARERWRKQPSTAEPTSAWAWGQLFFWAIITHPLLDACTTYGTQLFEPFGAQRVAWNTISVVDPLYTFPFLLLLLLAGRHYRQTDRRRWLNYAGLLLSSAYLLWTVYNHNRVDQVMERTLTQQQLVSSRRMVAPTIFNNILWSGTAEADSVYYYGLYSLLDSLPQFELVTIPKRHDLLHGHEHDRDVQILRWFSDGYYGLVRRPDGQLQFNDLRYGMLGNKAKPDDPNSYLFKWTLSEVDGQLRARQTREMGDRSMRSAIGELWQRMWGQQE